MRDTRAPGRGSQGGPGRGLPSSAGPVLLSAWTALDAGGRGEAVRPEGQEARKMEEAARLANLLIALQFCRLKCHAFPGKWGGGANNIKICRGGGGVGNKCVYN